MSSTSAYGDPETRRRILEATAELVESRGAAATMEDIAQRAGVSRQAVYLHFRDRRALLLALVAFMDEVLGVEKMAKRVFAAPDGIEMLRRTVDLYARLSPRIDGIAHAMEVANREDPDLRAAWQDRIEIRRTIHRQIFQRIADEGQLRDGWTVDEAAELFHALALPAVWRELTGGAGWSSAEYRRRLSAFLTDGLTREPASTSG